MTRKNLSGAAAFLLLMLAASLCFSSSIEMKPDGTFETPGFSFLVYHNDYLVGKRGGLQMILHGKRVMDAGELICVTPQMQFLAFDNQEMGPREVDEESGLSSVTGKFKPIDLSYDLICRTDGESIFITIKLDKTLDGDKISNLMLKFEIYPKEYCTKTYSGGGITGTFIERYMGKRMLIPSAEEIAIAPEDRLKGFRISSEDATLSLTDGRGFGSHSGFMVIASLLKKSSKTQFSIKITPQIDPHWRRDPVIQVSQVGYHPAQRKTAVLELDSRIEEPLEVNLVFLDKGGKRRVVKSEKPLKWGQLFDHKYYTFDFTEATEHGHYFLNYGTQETGPILIGPDVYKETWHPTMDVFFPVQMCHMEVRQGEKIWHGACHLDDGLQAPPNTEHFDSYRQKAESETPYKPNEHIPGLNWGGWHDAGDHDLPFGSICWTAMWMVLAKEEFDAARDNTSVNRDRRRVSLFQPDGKDDMLQQIAYGMEFLLSVYRALGHVGPGIIANNIMDYILVGDPVNVTDGLVYDPTLSPGEEKEGRSGKRDDRWIFTNRNTGGQYQFVQVAAVASRVLGAYDAKLAQECLRVAEEVWEYEQTHDPVHFSVSYQPVEDEFHSWELAATAELFLTTGENQYRNRLLELTPFIEKMPVMNFSGVSGFTMVRALEKIDAPEFRNSVILKSKELKSLLEEETAESPYGVIFDFKVWGNNWDVLDHAAKTYYFIKHLPEIFSEDLLYSAVNYNFGCHPASNHSYVSGVGINSATVGYGFNRAEWTYIPGGVVSGASFIRPKFIEYRSGAWDWYETEYVISGSAAFVFDVLAADCLLNRKK
jgi:endoglucanase